MQAKVTPEEYRELERSLMQKTLDKAESDPEWKQRLLEDPEAAQAEAGFPEAQQLRQMQEGLRPYDPESEEVRGHDDLVLVPVCHNFSHFVHYHYVVVYT